jgi:hypothetical protein
MKRLLPIFMMLALFLSQACEGPEGPAGAPGPAGPPGPAGTTGTQGAPGTPATSMIYEIGGWNFTAETNFELGIVFADYEMPVTESDAILVYRLWNVVEQTPVWRILPQVIYLPAQDTTQKVTLQYDFVHSPEALAIFMDGTADLNTLPEGLTTEQVFRIVVIPGQIAERRDGTKKKMNLSDYNVDYNNYEEVIKFFRLSDKNVRKISLK